MFLKKEKGSIVVEASIILPIFISFIILLITLIKIAIVDMTLDNVVHHATKQIATHFYPVDLLAANFNNSKLGELTNKGLDKFEDKRGEVIQIEDFLKNYSNFIPEEVKPLLHLRQDIEQKGLDAYNQTLNTIFQPVIDAYAEDSLEIEHLYVTKVTLPNVIQRENPYFGIEARYDMPLLIPFFNKTITFKKQAYERVWIGDEYDTYPVDKQNRRSEDRNEPNPPSGEQDVDDEYQRSEKQDEEWLRIDSINSPVQRGRVLRVVATGPKNKRADISIYYQSGFFKNESCTFNSTGWLYCNLKIGGHSNEGTYKAVITAGRMKDSANFLVLSKENYQRYLGNRKDYANKLKITN